MTPIEIRNEYQKAMRAQAEACRREISAVLQKYHCRLAAVPRVYLDHNSVVKASASFVVEPVDLLGADESSDSVEE